MCPAFWQPCLLLALAGAVFPRDLRLAMAPIPRPGTGRRDFCFHSAGIVTVRNQSARHDEHDRHPPITQSDHRDDPKSQRILGASCGARACDRLMQPQVDSTTISVKLTEAENLVRLGKYGEALPKLRELAAMGYWQVHAAMGDMLFGGSFDLRADPQGAVAAYRRGIFEADDPYAHLGLGRAFSLGVGVERDFAQAERHLRTALVNQVPGAELLLGGVLFELHRKDQRFHEAEELLKIAEKKGYIAAIAYLADIDIYRGKRLVPAWKKLSLIFRCLQLYRSDPDSPKLEGMRPGDAVTQRHGPVVDLAAARREREIPK